MSDQSLIACTLGWFQLWASAFFLEVARCTSQTRCKSWSAGPTLQFSAGRLSRTLHLFLIELLSFESLCILLERVLILLSSFEFLRGLLDLFRGLLALFPSQACARRALTQHLEVGGGVVLWQAPPVSSSWASQPWVWFGVWPGSMVRSMARGMVRGMAQIVIASWTERV